MSTDLSRFQDAFFEESAEHLSTMEEGLLQLEQRPTDLDLLNRIFRAAHSIKGNAGMFSFTDLSGFTHHVETVLDALRNGRIGVTKPVIDLLLDARDTMKTLLGAVQGQGSADAEAVEAIRVKLEACRAVSPVGAQHVVPLPRAEVGRTDASPRLVRYRIAWTPPDDVFQRGLDPARILQELADLGTVNSVTADLARVPDLQAIDPERCYLSWSIELETGSVVRDVESVFEFVREGSVLAITDVGAQHVVPLPPSTAEPTAERKRIGEILVEEGVATPEQIAVALGKQKRLGDILVEDRAVSPQQVQQALEKQRQMEAAAAARKAEPSSIRVDTTKIDKLINLVGELVITQSMISDLGHHFEMDKLPMLLERVVQLERNTREIQERVMAVRMVPIGTVFNRFPRLVRDLASSKRKQVRLTLSGEETELDKTVIESIGDPLTHLIRNAVDHGLELPEDRIARGKPEEGTITLNAFHQGGTICITVEDDGRGLNREKIVAKAIAQGLITEGETLSDDAVWPLIFRPGFSTAEAVTDVSGRGVGMDVVKRNIESLGGTVMIQTTEGRGSRFTLKLPLTLAIIEGMSVRVGPEIYIVPLTSIIESIRPRREEIKTIVGRGELVDVRGAYLPLIRLYHVFGGAANLTDPIQAVLMIVESEGERVALMVDELLGQQQVVIKNLSQNFRKVEGIAGATILGNGQVAFIVDVRGLLTVSREENAVAA
ncbi:MAG: chemotaxis protein CheA [Nitrospirae bacterium]|nr:chemotaxis protein CheA [Nitrospirota bacterium]